MDLFVSIFCCDFDISNLDQLLESYFPILIRVKELMDWHDILFSDVVLRFHEPEVVDKLLDSSYSIIISIIGGPEKAFQVVKADLCTLNRDQQSQGQTA